MIVSREIVEPSEEQHKLIGWMGPLTRTTAEEKLKSVDCREGVFLMRWSVHIKSYVLSYRTTSHHIEHVGYIHPVKGGVFVKTCDGMVAFFPSLVEYVKSEQRQGHITEPITTVTGEVINVQSAY